MKAVTVGFWGLVLALHPANAKTAVFESQSAGPLGREQELNGTVEPAEEGTYRDVEFEVEPGTIRVEFEVDWSAGSVIDWGLFDSRGRPAGFRGWSGSNKRHFFVARAAATPSFRAGEPPAGRWFLELGLAAIPHTTTYRIKVRQLLENTSANSIPAVAIGPATSSGPIRATTPRPAFTRGWLVGDLHLHTEHSDGACSVDQLATEAERRGLDFIAVTDHNTSSHFLEIAARNDLSPSPSPSTGAEAKNRLLVLAGREITTYAGHAVVLGGPPFLDYRYGPASNPEINTLLQQVQAFRGVVIVAHPALPTGPACRGCGWSHEATDWALVTGLEIDKDAFRRAEHTPAGDARGAFARRFGVEVEALETAEQLWRELLARGYRPAAIGSTDDHQCGHNPQRFDNADLGTIRTVVQTERRDAQGVLDGLRRHATYLQAEGAASPWLLVEAHNATNATNAPATTSALGSNQHRYQLGDVTAGESLVLFVHAEHSPGVAPDTRDTKLGAELGAAPGTRPQEEWRIEVVAGNTGAVLVTHAWFGSRIEFQAALHAAAGPVYVRVLHRGRLSALTSTIG